MKATNLIKKFLIEGFINKTMKLKDLINSQEAIKIIAETKLPVTLGFKIGLLIKKISPELEEYEKNLQKLKEEYFKKEVDEEGKETGKWEVKDNKIVMIDSENGEKEFADKYNALIDVDINVDIPEISASEFSSITIEPKHLINLDWLIKQ